MKRIVRTGIDVGTQQVKVVITEFVPREGGGTTPKVIGTGLCESRGLRQGFTVNRSEVSESVQKAVSQAEKISGMSVDRAFLSVGGIGLESFRARGESVIARSVDQVTYEDVDKALASAKLQASQKLVNRSVLHSIPLQHRLDGVPVLGNPIGMNGTKVEVEFLLITCYEQHRADLEAAVKAAGVDIIDVMASPLAGSLVTVSKTQKSAGVVLADIGAETVSLVVFEHGIPISLKVFPMGGSAITNEIALALRIPLEEAEQVKLGAVVGGTTPKKKIDDIVSAKLTEIFKKIDAELVSLGKDGLLPAGVVISGGSAGNGPVAEIARNTLRLPARVANIVGASERSRMKDSTWAVAYGLTIWSMSGSDSARKHKGSLWAWLMDTIERFLP